jgi:hypothetical protein
MPGPAMDIRAGVVGRRYQQQFGGAKLAVPVGAVSNDLCALAVEELDGLDASAMLVKRQRRTYINTGEPLARWPFALAYNVNLLEEPPH